MKTKQIFLLGLVNRDFLILRNLIKISGFRKNKS